MGKYNKNFLKRKEFLYIKIKNISSWLKILERKTKDKLQMGTNINKTGD